jgi:hypothetical protein
MVTRCNKTRVYNGLNTFLTSWKYPGTFYYDVNIGLIFLAATIQVQPVILLTQM